MTSKKYLKPIKDCKPLLIFTFGLPTARNRVASDRKKGSNFVGSLTRKSLQGKGLEEKEVQTPSVEVDRCLRLLRGNSKAAAGLEIANFSL